MKFYFNDESKRFKPEPFVKETEKVFKKLKISDKLMELGLNICSNKKIQRLNKKFRQIDQPTDVLSFPIDQPKKEQYIVLGDIVISFEEADIQSKELKGPIDKVMITLFRHGLLHLLGYDHEKNKKEWQSVLLKIEN